MSAEFLLTLATAAFGGAVTYTVCKHMPDRESPRPDLNQVDRFIESAPRHTNDVLRALD